jgi:hypothetical protein
MLPFKVCFAETGTRHTTTLTRIMINVTQVKHSTLTHLEETGQV